MCLSEFGATLVLYIINVFLRILKKKRFVRKTRAKNVDEIDTKGRFHQRFRARFLRAFFVRN